MSSTLHLACLTCKTDLWIGQRSYLYADGLLALERFLLNHQSSYGTDHTLLFVDDHWDEMYSAEWTHQYPDRKA